MSTFKDSLIARVSIKLRVSSQFNLVDKINNDDIEDALFDSIDEINSFPPSTNITIESLESSYDSRWSTLVVIGACAYAIDGVISEFVHNGIEATIGDISEPNRLEDYKSLAEYFRDRFNTGMEKLKISSQKICKSIHYKTDLTRRGSSVSKRYCKFNYSRIY